MDLFVSLIALGVICAFSLLGLALYYELTERMNRLERRVALQRIESEWRCMCAELISMTYDMQRSFDRYCDSTRQ